MSFPTYAEYKDSGVEWLGEVPEHWKVASIKHVVSTPVTDGPHETPEFIDEGIPFVSAEAVSSGEINFAKIRGFISQTDHDRYCQKYKPRLGDVYMVKSGASTGTTAIVEDDREFSIWSPLAAIRCDKESHPKFMLNFLRSRNFQEGVTLNWSFGTQQNIGMNVIENLQVTRPPLPEQTTIASFLDTETSKIDSLVSEQRRLIELLKEKRQAVISRAVTKGLDPSVPMKDSGIEWLGEVPEGWEVGPLKRFWSVTDCKHVTAEFVDEGGIPLASIREVQSKWVELGEAKRTTQEFYDLLIGGGRHPQVGDLIFSRNATVGEVAQVKNDTPQFAMGQDVCLMRRIHRDSSPDYWQHLIKSTEVVEQMSVLMVGATFKRINVDEIRNLSVVSPPLDEQTVIAEFLDIKVERFDLLVAQAERAIELLQERRTALISAAVTGKIDVREFATEAVA